MVTWVAFWIAVGVGSALIISIGLLVISIGRQVQDIQSIVDEDIIGPVEEGEGSWIETPYSRN